VKVTKSQASLLDDSILLKDVVFGQAVLAAGKVLVRVKPVNYLCNSTIINEAISKGNVLVVDASKGTCYITDGSKPCKPLTSELIWSEQ
jgi:Tfp pilus assembly ATPase PilU